MKYPDARILVMSKAPVPGTVKTRLIPLLGATGAAHLYRQMLEGILGRLYAAALCPVALYCAPDTRHAFFSDCRQRYALELFDQADGDLGRRMSQAVSRALGQARRVVVIGGDCPTLVPDDIDTALRALAGDTDVVLGPATDGGYYLLGVRAHHPRLFEAMPWGSERVLDTTLQRVRELGLACRQLTTRRDIDTPLDYNTWQNCLAPNESL